MAGVNNVSSAGSMFTANTNTVSTATDPYSTQTYSPESTDKNTLTISSYFKLLAAEMANQDMTNPMDSSEIMNQMSQMAMVQSLASMTTALQTSTALSKTSYAASMIGKEVTLNVASGEVDEETGATSLVKGVIASVNISGEEPTFKLEGDDTEYSMDKIMSIGKGVVNATSTSGTAATSTSALTGKAKIIAELAKMNIKGTEEMTYTELTELYENGKDGKMPKDKSLWIDASKYDDYDWSIYDEKEEEEKVKSTTSTTSTTTTASTVATTTATETEETSETKEVEEVTTIDQQAAAASESMETVEEAEETSAEEESETVEETEATSKAQNDSEGE